MIEINLIPDVKQELIKAQRVRNKVITFSILSSLLSVGVVIALLVFVFIGQAATSAVYDSKINQYNDLMSKVPDLSKKLTIQNQLKKINEVNGNKKIDSRLFDLLNKIIPPAPNNIQISDLTIDAATSTITINGQAANSYAALEVFKKTIAAAQIKYNDSDSNQITSDLASNISTGNTSYGEDASGTKVLRFTLSFVYDQAFFSPNIKSLSIVLSNTGNVTDSYLGVPTTIFADPATDLTGGGQ